jgi:hypothetical protein
LSVLPFSGAWTISTMIWNQRPIGIMYEILSQRNSTLLTADMIFLYPKKKKLYLIHVSDFPFHSKICVLLVRSHCPPIWPPPLPLNITYIWIVTSKLPLRRHSIHTSYIPRPESHAHVPSFMSFNQKIHQSVRLSKLFHNKINSVAFSLQANYTDWVTTTSWRILVPTFVDRGMSHGQRGGAYVLGWGVVGPTPNPQAEEVYTKHKLHLQADWNLTLCLLNSVNSLWNTVLI